MPCSQCGSENNMDNAIDNVCAICQNKRLKIGDALPPSSRSIKIKRKTNIFIWLGFFIVSFVFSYYASTIKDALHGDTMFHVIPTLIGNALGMMLFPAIAGFLVMGVGKLVRKPVTPAAFYIVVGVCWIYIAQSVLTVANFNP